MRWWFWYGGCVGRRGIPLLITEIIIIIGGGRWSGIVAKCDSNGFGLVVGHWRLEVEKMF